MKSMCHDVRRNSPSVTVRSPASLLQPDDVGDRGVLGRAELLVGDAALGVTLPGVEEHPWSQEAADVVAAERGCGSQLEVPPGSGAPRRARRSWCTERPNTLVSTASTGAGIVLPSAARSVGVQPSRTQAKKMPPRTGETRANFLPISLITGSSSCSR